MTIEDDTEWLRTELHKESFHRDHPHKWIAVRDTRIVYRTSERNDLQQWLDVNDRGHRCVLAFGDDRIIV